MRDSDSKPTYELERKLRSQGFRFIAGVDEAGRGPLAGPVAAAAVILAGEPILEGLNDSKKLTPRRRSLLFPRITANSVSACVAMVWPGFIDRYGIVAATEEAIRRAVWGLCPRPDAVLVDGLRVSTLDGFRQVPVAGGDASCCCIAAASVLAKVSRDIFMAISSEHYPAYGFDKNKGYGTLEHIAAIRRHGVCGLHRRSFCRF